jgi:hypothetical protein
LTPQEAFFARQIEIDGDIERALKLAVLLEQFITEFPYKSPTHAEAHIGCA